jgi:ATP-dependent DNA helicase RecG
MISKEGWDQLLPQIEQDRVEKTISRNDADKFGEAICSFANDLPNHKQPGYLLAGVNDNGSRAGMDIDERQLQALLDFRTDGRIVPPPALTVARFSYADGDIAVVEVQPHFLPPVRYKGKLCIRAGLRKGIANEAEERILTEKRSAFARTFDVLPCKGSILDDISIDLFKLRYLPPAIDAEMNWKEYIARTAIVKR